MRISRNICSRLWTDTNISFAKKSIKHCCKQSDNIINLDTIDSLGHDVFEKNQQTINDKNSMIVNNCLPDSCSYCKENDEHSIRHVWNSWSDAFIDHYNTELLNSNFVEYFEFDIGKSCNLACIYCGPWSSTSWAKELGESDNSSDLDQSWKTKILTQLAIYLTQLPKDRRIVFNILGGEPLLITDTYDILEYIAKHCDNFEVKPLVMITTNLMVKPALMDRLLKTVNSTKNKLEWSIAISIEDIKDRAEKTRFHLNWEQFESNVNLIKDKVDKIYFTTTFNFFNYPNFDEFLDWVFDIMGYANYGTYWNLTLNVVQGGFTDIAYMQKEFVDHNRLKNEFSKHINRVLQTPGHTATKVKLDSLIGNFNEHINNLYARAGTKKINTQFIGWWKRMDERRNMSYLDTYPLNEMLLEHFYNFNPDLTE